MRILRVLSAFAVAVVLVGCTASSPPPSGTVAPATPHVTPASTPSIAFLPLDLPDEYSRGWALAVDGTTAVGWVQKGQVDEAPAVWDTSTGALRVLDVPEQFLHPNGDMFVQLVGVSGSTAVGRGILGTGSLRGRSRPLAFDTSSGELTPLDIPEGLTQAEVHAIDRSTAVGQAWAEGGEIGGAVVWDTTTSAVRILETPPRWECVNAQAISGDTIVGTRCEGDDASPIVWRGLDAIAQDLDRLPDRANGVPLSIDGTTAVGHCCFGEEGTPLPLLWDTTTGAVRQLDLPSQFQYGKAVAVSGGTVAGFADFTPLVWDLEEGTVEVLPAHAGYDEHYSVQAISGRTLVGIACPPPPSEAENPRCVAAAWTLP